MSLPPDNLTNVQPMMWDTLTAANSRDVEVGKKMFVPHAHGFNFESCAPVLTKNSTFNDICKRAFGTDWSYSGQYQTAGSGELIKYPDTCGGSATGYPICRLDTASAPVDTYCTTGVSGSMLAAVDPALRSSDRYTTPKCVSAWQTKCTSNNIGRDSECKNYADANINDGYVERTMGAYCTGKMDDPFCQAWCKRSNGACDVAIGEYCKDKPDGPGICSCVNSLIDGAKCYDKSCINGGYQTKNMQRETCPPADCQIINNITAGGSIIDLTLDAQQQCGKDKPTDQSDDQSDVTDDDDNMLEIIIVLLFILLIIIVVTTVGGVVAYKKFPDKFRKLLFWK